MRQKDKLWNYVHFVSCSENFGTNVMIPIGRVRAWVSSWQCLSNCKEDLKFLNRITMIGWESQVFGFLGVHRANVEFLKEIGSQRFRVLTVFSGFFLFFSFSPFSLSVSPSLLAVWGFVKTAHGVTTSKAGMEVASSNAALMRRIVQLERGKWFFCQILDLNFDYSQSHWMLMTSWAGNLSFVLGVYVVSSYIHEEVFHTLTDCQSVQEG